MWCFGAVTLREDMSGGAAHELSRIRSLAKQRYCRTTPLIGQLRVVFRRVDVTQGYEWGGAVHELSRIRSLA